MHMRGNFDELDARRAINQVRDLMNGLSAEILGEKVEDAKIWPLALGGAPLGCSATFRNRRSKSGLGRLGPDLARYVDEALRLLGIVGWRLGLARHDWGALLCTNNLATIS